MKTKSEQIFPLQFLKGVGPRRAEVLASEGLVTISDLLHYIPRTYITQEKVPTLSALSIKLRFESNIFYENTNVNSIYKSEVNVIGRVIKHKENTYGRTKKFLILTLADNSGGEANIVFWQYTDFYKKQYPIGQLISVTGRPELDPYNKINFNHPDIEKFSDEDEEDYHSGNILPIYKLTEKMRNAGLNTPQLRKIIQTAINTELQNLQEVLPKDIISQNKFPSHAEAISNLHFPKSLKDIEISQSRMKYQEIFFFEIYLAIRQTDFKISEKGVLINPKSNNARTLIENLGFELTNDQKKVIRDIMTDMGTHKPMNRLLQGDVGSGKTIVSILTMLAVIENGYQVALMAPTEILAEQHYHTLLKLTEGFDLKIVQLIGGQKAKFRREVLEDIESGKANIIVGTHALCESKVNYHKLAYVIIDEQHRFGVSQRAALKELASKSFENDITPHILVMSATPIPRTLSLTVYGELDVSVIKEIPKNRLPIKTKVAFENQMSAIYDFIRQRINHGEQVYIVYPLVEKSEKIELKAATDHYEILSTEIFPDLKCGLLHGQMLWYEKEDTMKAFLNKEYQILVATTVIEVGIDIPNATVMLIENAERFGLSQLHQLRGRVGRSSQQSYCILSTKEKFKYELMKDKNIEEQKSAIIRLKTMEKTTDGFEIAEIDLKLRGPGDMLGTKQSGLPEFKFLDLINDLEIISKARNDAFSIVQNDRKLEKKSNQLLKEEMIRKFTKSNYFDIA